MKLRSDAARNRELLLTAAREVFAEQGLDASLEEIARRAGVSIGTLYHRFGSRLQLIDTAFADRVAESVEAAERALDDPDPWHGLVEHLDTICRWQANDRGYTEICVRALPDGSETEKLKARGHELFAQLVERAQQAGALRADVTLTDIGLLTWAVVRATDGIRDTEPEAWRRHLAILLDGLRPAAAHELPAAALDAEAVRQAMTIG